ncbi:MULTISPECIES: SDR family oxidoreductase [Thermoanaerobacterium]|uniref:NAD-dependent epimerase/dehydratase n=2 Tax=Thermoanaerobacterium TaxID=28895 RepID=W9E9C6_9THEO|nr:MULTISPECIES: SDR family oxidoreductase [Thermoanaerobacterium]AFK85625.1 NAD-dependent epimerase/dehydratase [Thermoanaerobacterium saccharolyticum JW/SL-YS485]ETO37440.1 NAD-dependent epimerase/dehydratase [Thermoanaerobacterium aotearoense SCUT27]
MNILVTGGAGFIGSNIVDLLIDNGYDVAVVDNLSTGKKENINKKARFYNIDITDDDLYKVFEYEKIDIVIHHAAQIDIQRSINDPVFDAKVNIIGTINLLECCRKYDVKKIVYASSAAVYGDPEYLGVDEKHRVNPISYYGISKHTPEHYIKVYNELYGLKYTILRYANVYGIRQDPKGEGGVISIFIDKMLSGKNPVIFGDGNQTRDFIYVKDVAKANLLALEKGDNEIINISTNRSTTINELVEIMNKFMEKPLKPIYKEPRKGDILHSYLDNKKAKDVLRWKPDYSLEDGLKETIKYYRLKYASDEVAAIKEK